MNTDVTKRLTYPSSPNLRLIEVHRYVCFCHENLYFMANIAVFLFLVLKLTYTQKYTPMLLKVWVAQENVSYKSFQKFLASLSFEIDVFWCHLDIFCQSHVPNSCCMGDWTDYLSGFSHFLNNSIFVFQAEKRRTRAKQGEQESCKLSTLLLSHCCTRSYDNNMPDNCHVPLHS